jgi:hypothetical protein
MIKLTDILKEHIISTPINLVKQMADTCTEAMSAHGLSSILEDYNVSGDYLTVSIMTEDEKYSDYIVDMEFYIRIYSVPKKYSFSGRIVSTGDDFDYELQLESIKIISREDGKVVGTATKNEIGFYSKITDEISRNEAIGRNIYEDWENGFEYSQGDYGGGDYD